LHIAVRDTEDPRLHTALASPSYETMFRTLGQTVVLDAPLSGEPSRDAAAVLAAITSGRSFSILRALASPASLTFTAEQDGVTSAIGGRLPIDPPLTRLHAAIPQAPGGRLTILAYGPPV